MSLTELSKKHNLVDGGERETLPTGGMREPNPVRYDLIPFEALHRLGIHFANGSKKYAPRNWEKGISTIRAFNSAVGHLFKYAFNRAYNREHEEDHLAAAMWNIVTMITYEDRCKRGLIDEEVDKWDTVWGKLIIPKESEIKEGPPFHIWNLDTDTCELCTVVGWNANRRTETCHRNK